MAGLPAELQRAIREGLLKTGLFVEPRTIVPVFVDSRISRWQHHIPNAPTASERADALIARLAEEEAGLALLNLLQVVQEKRHKEDALRWEIARVAGRLAGHLQNPQTDDEAPFRGLPAFHEEHAHLFFGRERVTDELLAHCQAHPFLCVVGASGSGKSSVVRAGVVPAVRRGALGQAHQWRVATITPTRTPLKTLAVALTRNLPLAKTTELHEELPKSVDTLDTFLHRELAENERLFLLVDQFEELFAPSVNDAERRSFVENLMQAVTPNGRLMLVLTFRADFYEFAARYDQLWTQLQRYQYNLVAMDGLALQSAIEQPLEDTRWRFQGGLVETILHDVGATDGGRPEPGALPLLSHALLETWRRREGDVLTLVGYREAGGAAGAIAQTAERVYQALDPADQPHTQAIFLQLVELGEGTQDTRRRTLLTTLLSDDTAGEETRSVLTNLASERLIVTNDSEVEVAHEALIRNWPRLRGWLDENRDDLRLYRRLADDAKEWASNDRRPDFLYRGSRLAQLFEVTTRRPDWFKLSEMAFIETAQKVERQAQAEREAQRQRELAQQRALAKEAQARQEAQAQARTEAEARVQEQAETTIRLRRRFMYVLVAFVVASVTSFFAISASIQATAANNAQATEVAIRTTAEVRAENNLATATIALISAASAQASVLEQRDIAQAESTRAFEALATATSAQGEAQTNALVANEEAIRANREAQIALAQSLAAIAPIASVSGLIDPDLQTLLALEALRLTEENGGDTVWLADSAFRLVMSPPDSVPLSHEYHVSSVAFSPDGRMLASGSSDSKIRLWDIANLTVEPTILQGHEFSVSSVAFSPNGQMLASGGFGTIRLWDIDDPTAAPIILQGHEFTVNSVAFSPDGRTLASGSDDRTIRLWDIADSIADPTILQGEYSVKAVAFSPDGKTLASGGADGRTWLWDMGDLAAEPTVLQGEENYVNSVAFSPDGRLLASGGNFGTIMLWDMHNPTVEPIILQGDGYSVNTVAFSPGGQRWPPEILVER